MKVPYRGQYKLEDLIFLINKPLIGKKGVNYQKLLKDWRLIVGDDIARTTVPTKIISRKKQNSTINILYIAANNSAIIAELVYHMGVITEQINFYFGYEYINQLKFVQAVFEVEPVTIKNESKISKEASNKLTNILESYKEEDQIKYLLKELGTNILKRS
jgi:hypothetical protein